MRNVFKEKKGREGRSQWDLEEKIGKKWWYWVVWELYPQIQSVVYSTQDLEHQQ